VLNELIPLGGHFHAGQSAIHTAKLMRNLVNSALYSPDAFSKLLAQLLIFCGESVCGFLEGWIRGLFYYVLTGDLSYLKKIQCWDEHFLIHDLSAKENAIEVEKMRQQVLNAPKELMLVGVVEFISFEHSTMAILDPQQSQAQMTAGLLASSSASLYESLGMDADLGVGDRISRVRGHTVGVKL
jgi:hypothetical protein